MELEVGGGNDVDRLRGSELELRYRHVDDGRPSSVCSSGERSTRPGVDTQSGGFAGWCGVVLYLNRRGEAVCVVRRK